ncbi:MAG: hypothetical protein ACTS2F_20385 [Thainema sp.]
MLEQPKQQQMLTIYLQEYSKLKDEQSARIGFRDNLLYVTLGLFGGILTFSLGETLNPYALLVLPWVSLILGWTYLVNDQKITAIGRYLRYGLVDKVHALIGDAGLESIFGWEIVHRSDLRRQRRKLEQLVVDEVTFVLSGIIGLVVFGYFLHQPSSLNPQLPMMAIVLLMGVELGLLIILGIEIFLYADLAKGR